MVNVTINMPMDDFEYIKESLLIAEENTASITGKREQLEERIRVANAHIKFILTKLGM